MRLRLLSVLSLVLAVTGCPGSHGTDDAGADAPILPLDVPPDTWGFETGGRDVGVACGSTTCAPGDSCCLPSMVCARLCDDPDSGLWCRTPQDARGVGGCEAELGVVWTGSACMTLSGCSCEGFDCDALFETVEACVAAHPGCPRNCGGLAVYDCLDTEICDYPDGSFCGGDDSAGTCVPRPTDCPEPGGVPVCGCDGVDYLTECSAGLAGTDVAHLGPCDDAEGEAPRAAKVDGACGVTGGVMWIFTFGNELTACSDELAHTLQVRVFRELDGAPGDVTIEIDDTFGGADASLCEGDSCEEGTGSITIHGFERGAVTSVSYDLRFGDLRLVASDVSTDLFCSTPPTGCR